MKRRGFITGLTTLVVAGLTSKLASAQRAQTSPFRFWFEDKTLIGNWYPHQSPAKFGRIKVNETPIAQLCRVWLDGREVSADCFEADDLAGYVMLYKRNAEGKFYLQHSPRCTDPSSNTRDLGEAHEGCDHLAQERLNGEVTIRLRDGLTPGQLNAVSEWQRSYLRGAYIDSRGRGFTVNGERWPLFDL